MSALRGHVSDYLRLRRAFGFKLEREGQLLGQLVSYLEAVGGAALTSQLAIAWAREPANAQPNHWAKRLGVVRKFAAYLHTIDPTAEVPPPGVFPARRHRPTPYLWSQHDICRLLEGARALLPSLRAETHGALFGLLATSGMRVGEAVGRIAATRSGCAQQSCVSDHVRAGAPSRWDAHRDGDLPECFAHAAAVERGADVRHEEGTRVWSWAQSVTFRRIATQRLGGARMQRHQPGPAELGLPDRDDTGAEVDVVVLQGHRRRRTHRRAIHLPRSYQPGRHLLVPVRLSGADGARL